MKIGVYKYNGSVCGASFAIPQIAGLFLLSRQIDKEIRFNEFIEIIKNPQMVNKDGTNYINANEIIKKVEKNRREKIEKINFFHDQKSDVFFQDKASGVYPISDNLSESIVNRARSNSQKARDVVDSQKELKTNYRGSINPTIEIDNNKMVDDE